MVIDTGTFNDIARHLELAHEQSGEGPCVDAYRQDTVVAEPDLADPVTRRWPVFTPAALQAGDVDLARQLLTRPYRVRGMVTHGAGRGAKLGFPTANLAAIDTLLPAQGVYAARAITAAGNWPTAINIGPNPTFGEQALKVEAHLIGFEGSLYGQPLEVGVQVVADLGLHPEHRHRLDPPPAEDQRRLGEAQPEDLR
jgi:hypothetical protein